MYSTSVVYLIVCFLSPSLQICDFFVFYAYIYLNLDLEKWQSFILNNGQQNCICADLKWSSRDLSLFTVRNIVTARLCFHRHLWFCSQAKGCGRHTPPGRNPPGQTPLPSACWDTPPCPVHVGIHAPPPPVATAADGMHPTGRHSCFKCQFKLNQNHDMASLAVVPWILCHTVY